MSSINTVSAAVVADDTNTDAPIKTEVTGASQASDSIRMVQRSKLKVDRARNPRKMRRYEPKELSSMVRSILLHGLMEPIVVSERPNGELWVLKGHRRLAALNIIANDGLEKDAFGPAIAADPTIVEKVKCRVLKGLSLQGEMDLVMDHSDVLGLDKQERLLTAKILTKFGFSHEFIAGKVGGSRSNYTNGIAKVLELPSCVEEMYLNEGNDALTVSQPVLKELKIAYDADRKAGTPLKEAGPKFTAAWEKFLKDGATPPIKSINRADLNAVASVEADPYLRAILVAIADGDKSGLGTALEAIHTRLIPLDTVGTGVVRVEEGIESTVGDFVRVED